MKAVYIKRHGGREVLTYGDMPDPQAGHGEVKIRVRACSINRLDVYTRIGVRGTRLDLTEPRILGGDASGDVIEIGQDVAALNIGDRVVVNPRLTCGECGSCDTGYEELCDSPGQLGLTSNGSYAEYVTVPARNVLPISDSISYELAASLPTVFMPSWNILVRRAELRPSETALILSASSGVGSAAIQVAKSVIGARVIATTSNDDKASLARQLGADDVINYSVDSIEERVNELTEGRGVDVVLDHVGADFWPASFRSMAPGGRYGICGVTSGYKAELQMGVLLFVTSRYLGYSWGGIKI